MASNISFVTYILDQLEGIEDISSKKLFGEYAIYFNKKIVALICDNRLLIKITNSGREYIKDVKEDFPYPGALVKQAINAFRSSVIRTGHAHNG